MTFTIPELRMPTLQERRGTSAAWMEPLHPCLYTHWPERYRELSFRTAVEQLSPKEVQRLIDTFDGEPLGQPEDAVLLWKIRRGLAEFDTGAFFRLESRSPKDNYWGEVTNYRACSWHDVGKLLYSERLLDDLARYLHADEPLRLLFREWHPIPKSSEFRCFIRNRKLAGISQYHYAGFDECRNENRTTPYADIYGRAKDREAKLKAFIADEIIPHLPVDDLVADLWIDRMSKITLIEINPYGLSDPCLFSYDELETATGLFRVVEADAVKQIATSGGHEV